MHLNDIRKELQVWILAEETAGRSVDINRVNEHLQEIMIRQNSAPRSDFNGLSPEDMHNIMYDPFRDQCVVQLNKLDKNQYE